jgi:anti-sigma factor RsiW
MRCSSCEPLLDAYLEGVLRPRQTRAVAAHLRACDGCCALLRELRVVDALLATAHRPGVGADFTAAVVSATRAAELRTPRRVPLWAVLLLYLGVAWAVAAVAAIRSNDLVGLVDRLVTFELRDLAALGAAVRALAPATPLAAAAVTGILMLDLLLLCAIFYGYRRLRPVIELYLDRGERS